MPPAVEISGLSKGDLKVAPVQEGQLSTIEPSWQPSLYANRADYIEAYEKMRRDDIVLRQALTFFSNIVINLVGEYQNEDENIAEFVRATLKNTRGGYRSLLRWLLRAPLIGFALAEKVYAQEQFGARRVWTYAAFPRIPARSVARNGIVMDEALGQPNKIVQWGRWSGIGEITIPGEKVVHWAPDDTGDGYGDPIARGLLPLREAKEVVEKMSVTGVKRLAQKITYEKVPFEQTETGTKGKAYQEWVAERWKDAHGGSVMIRPVSKAMADMGLPSIEVHDAGGFSKEFLDLKTDINRAYFMAFGIPALVMMEPQHATRAQAVVQSDASRFALLPVARELAEQCLMRDIVRPLIEINFGERDDYGHFPVTLPVDESQIAELLGALGKAGFLTMTVDEGIYRKVQSLVPSVLPPFEETTLAREGQAQTPGSIGI